MIKVFTKFKPTVIHSVYVFPSIIMGLLGNFFRVPSILHGRGTDLNYLPFISLRSKILAKIAGKLNKIIIVVSKAMRHNCLKLNIPYKKIITIYDGVNFSQFDPIGKKFYSLNKTLEILHIGRFSFEKCHKLIIETSKDLRDNDVNFHLTFMGIGPLKKKIEYLVRKNKLENYITFTGWVDHDMIPNYMVKADLLILPSITEGLPVSVLEAMSMKLPVILTKVGGMPEIAQQIGCILIEKNNKEQLYNAIMDYIKNPQNIEHGGKINREFIIKNFNWDLHAEKLYKIYLKLKK